MAAAPSLALGPEGGAFDCDLSLGDESGFCWDWVWGFCHDDGDNDTFLALFEGNEYVRGPGEFQLLFRPPQGYALGWVRFR